MIILSKHKDYYDYLVGIYGRDENKVFDRRQIITAEEFEFDDKAALYNENQYRDHDRYYWLDESNYVDIVIVGKLYRVEQVKQGVWEQHKFDNDRPFSSIPISKILAKEEDKFVDYIETDYHKKYKKPIMIYERLNNFRGMKNQEPLYTDKTPLLSSFGFGKFLSPEIVYRELDNFLGWLKDNPPIEDKRTDLEKLQSKGFDKKISFRHRK